MSLIGPTSGNSKHVNYLYTDLDDTCDAAAKKAGKGTFAYWWFSIFRSTADVNRKITSAQRELDVLKKQRKKRPWWRIW